MNTSKWLEAAESYRLNNGRIAQNSTEQKSEEEAKKQKEQEEARKKQEQIYRGMEQLSAFLDDHGSDAMALLKASGRHIIFGESRDGGGFSVVYMINGDGLHQCVESTSVSATFGAGSNPRPVPTKISILKATEAAVRYGGKRGTEVVKWLKTELDKIAEAAPK